MMGSAPPTTPYPSLAKEGSRFHGFWVPVSRRASKTALRIVVRASRPLSRGHPARERERDAPATAGETPAPHPSAVGPFSWFPGARQATGMSDCSVIRYFRMIFPHTGFEFRRSAGLQASICRPKGRRCIQTCTAPM